MKNFRPADKQKPSSSAETLQPKTADGAVSEPNKTGLPDNLKAGIENLSGYSMNDVKVHYNSSAPAQLSAHAYAQGTDIHVAPGQERHVPHEAWHVVQQKQGRVKPTRQLKGKTHINDDAGLEAEADAMGTKALQGGMAQAVSLRNVSAAGAMAVQRKPTDFANRIQGILNLQAGEGTKSKDIRSFIKGIDFFKNITIVQNIVSTPWDRVRNAVQAYANLGDAVIDDQHLRAILEVQAAFEAWKIEHKVGEKDDDELNPDEQQKLMEIQQVEPLLPDEIQYSRKEKGTPPDMEGIIAERIKFVFKDAFGKDFAEMRAEKVWPMLLSWSSDGGFDEEKLLGQDLPEKTDLEGFGKITLFKLAVARTEKRYAGSTQLLKLDLLAMQCSKLANISSTAMNPNELLAEPFEQVTLRLIDEDLRSKYPEMAEDLLERIKSKGLSGLDTEMVFKATAQNFLSHAPRRVKSLKPIKLNLLKKNIESSPEYLEFTELAKTYGQGITRGKHLPQDGYENLKLREHTLMGTIAVELLKMNDQGQALPENQQTPNDVSKAKKQSVVLAIMTIEKIIGRELGRYPTFVLVRKPGRPFRANADSKNGQITYSENFTMATAVHELGHYYENQSKLGDWFPIYLMMRSRHVETAQKLEKSETKTYNYSRFGMDKEEGFLGGLKGMGKDQGEYTARAYDTGHTELVSMFTERIIDREKMDRILDEDPQGFAIILKLLRPKALPEWDLHELGYR